MTIDVFDFLDYRAYLRAFYVAKKDENTRFSYRAFARKAGFKSPNYLKLVMEGERNLSSTMAERFAHACGLADERARYFVNLVAFNQARTTTERNLHYGRLTTFREYREAHRIDMAHSAYHSEWYIPAVRELVARADFREDPEWIATTLIPEITKAGASRALSVLLDLGLIRRLDSGELAQSDTLVSTGAETQGLHIRNYHRTMMDRAAESIDLVPATDRDLSALTLSLNADGIRRMKARLQTFRRELLELSAHEEEPSQVVQINMQLFPLSRAKGDPSCE